LHRPRRRGVLQQSHLKKTSRKYRSESAPSGPGRLFRSHSHAAGLSGKSSILPACFPRRPEAGRFWKDLIVNILQEIETTPQKASIDLDSKGEMEPLSNSSMR
jgi:hypothetical protein